MRTFSFFFLSNCSINVHEIIHWASNLLFTCLHLTLQLAICFARKRSRNHPAISWIVVPSHASWTIIAHLLFFFNPPPPHNFQLNMWTVSQLTPSPYYLQGQRWGKVKLLALVLTRWVVGKKGKKWARKCGERENQVCCLLLHPSVLKVQVELYSLHSVCVRARVCVCGGGGGKKKRAMR